MRRTLLAGAIFCSTCAPRSAAFAQASSPERFTLAQTSPPESIYAPPQPQRENEGVNEGGVDFDLTVRYMTDYVFRGIDRSEIGGHEDSPNLQFDGKFSFDLGKLPHPFFGLFINVYDADPISQFQEFRPTVGFDWLLKPFQISAGHNTYIFPDRRDLNTAEFYGKVALDDSFIWSSERPILSPYVYAAYDYDLYNGWYFEAGVKHDFVFEESGVTLTLIGDVAYVLDNQQFLRIGTNDNGFQHYDIGLIGTYSLNNLLNIPRRYGEVSLQGYIYYTDGLDSSLLSDTQIWGGAGINFHY